ncbi:hypothetical protein QYF36_022980 [Acer negundo]|nr:hypothetical protein QYF36_022980 [Acer negundo]
MLASSTNVFLSSSSSDYIIVVIYGHLYRLAYSKPGDKAWTIINTWRGRYFDITYHKGQFYAINCKGMVMVFNFNGGDNPTEAQQVAQLPSALLQYTFEYCYLLESAGALLIVTRQGMTARPLTEHSSKWTYGTFGFQVFEVDLNTNTWTEIKDLGNRSIFVGHKSLFSVEVSDISYYKPNSIYYTDDCSDSYFSQRKGGGKDVGIYNMKDGSVIPLFRTNLLSRLCPPMWVEQSFK